MNLGFRFPRIFVHPRCMCASPICIHFIFVKIKSHFNRNTKCYYQTSRSCGSSIKSWTQVKSFSECSHQTLTKIWLSVILAWLLVLEGLVWVLETAHLLNAQNEKQRKILWMMFYQSSNVHAWRAYARYSLIFLFLADSTRT